MSIFEFALEIQLVELSYHPCSLFASWMVLLRLVALATITIVFVIT